MKSFKTKLAILLIFASVLTCFAQNSTKIKKKQLIGTWEPVDSLGSPDTISDHIQYKTISPQTFIVVGTLKSKGLLSGIYMGEYELNDSLYTEHINYSYTSGTHMLGRKNIFKISITNDILHISGVNNYYNQYWKKIDKLPNVEAKNSLSTEFAGGNGLNMNDAVIVKASNKKEGKAAELKYIAMKYGIENYDWNVSQTFISNKNKDFDIIRIKLIRTNQEINIYFKVTDFFGE